MKVSFLHLIYNGTIVKNGLSNHFLPVEDKQTKERTNKHFWKTNNTIQGKYISLC